MSNKKQALLVVVSAPSGAGKTTLCNGLLDEFTKMARSISCTTREKRRGEVDGKDYFFISEDTFTKRMERGDFLEYALVHGHRYGTPREPVEKLLAAGRDVLMAIDVQGAQQIRDKAIAAPPDSLLRKGFVDIFVIPPSRQVLKQRLIARGQDRPDDIRRRLIGAAKELARMHEFKYRVVNDDLDTALDALRCIVRAEHLRLQ